MNETTPSTPSTLSTPGAASVNANRPVKLMLLGLLIFLVGVNLLPLINEIFYFIAPYLAPVMAQHYFHTILIDILGGVVAIAGIVVALVGFFSRAKPA